MNTMQRGRNNELDSCDFPCCCAGDILYGFGNTTYAHETGSTSEEIEAFIKEHIENYMTARQGFSMIIINNEQEKLMIPILKRHGFRRIAKNIYHPNHGTYIHIYLKEYQRDNPRNERRREQIQKRNNYGNS